MWNKTILNKMSSTHQFNKSTLEKVHRLIELLRIFNTDKVLKNNYVLKGGTAINLCLYDFPRLSVDIDMNYNKECSREEMQAERDLHKKVIHVIARLNNYMISDKSRYSHILDSYVLNYTNLEGRPDNIKIELNYINRVMIMEPQVYKVESSIFGKIDVLALDKIELYSSKIAALIGRTTSRDLYDVYKMVVDSQVNKQDFTQLRANTIFYLMTSNSFLSLEELQSNFTTNLTHIDYKNIKQNLIPMLAIGKQIDVKKMKEIVSNFVLELFDLTNEEKQFIQEFNTGVYNPQCLFDAPTSKRLSLHPMALWKMVNYEDK